MAVYVRELVHQAEGVQRKTTLDQGKTLRTALGIKGSPLLERRKVRNALEHFDDRLDRYFEPRLVTAWWWTATSARRIDWWSSVTSPRCTYV
jgi:hypothetical protein